MVSKIKMVSGATWYRASGFNKAGKFEIVDFISEKNAMAYVLNLTLTK